MRLAILDDGHPLPTKVLFAVIRAVTRSPVADALKTNRYRPDFYGLPMRVLTQKLMRGDSSWSVGDRELMGACVSQANECQVCTATHGGVAALAYQDDARVASVLADLEAAPIDERLRATIRLLRKLTREHGVTVDDVRAVLAAGVSREQLEDALAVAFVFNVVDRLSRTFGWVVASPRASSAGSRFLFKRGYG